MASLVSNNGTDTTTDIPYKLYMYVNRDNEELNEIYDEKINVYNHNVICDEHPDSGFDLFVPHDIEMSSYKVTKVDFNVKCKMVKLLPNGEERPCAFYMYPRSSISKTYFRLANNVGIIDCGYRGALCGMFDVIHSTLDKTCPKNQRLVQICTPTLSHFKLSRWKVIATWVIQQEVLEV